MISKFDEYEQIRKKSTQSPQKTFAQSAGTVEYTDCTSAEG